jgi:hypothetical protein
MSYHSVIWDGSGNLVAEKMLSIKISILQGSVTGTIHQRSISHFLFVKITFTAIMFFVKSLEVTTYKCSISFYETF